MSQTIPKVKRQTVTTDVNLPNATETVVATLEGVSTPAPDARVRLDGWVQLTSGAAATAFTVRIRRGTTASGTLIGEANAEQLFVAAASSEERSISVQDTPGDVASQSYVLTVEVTGGAAAATALQASLTAIISTA